MSGFIDLKTVKEYLQSQGNSLNNLNGGNLTISGSLYSGVL